jgi:hypothetical protein
MICAAALETPFHVGVATPEVEALMAVLGPALGLHFVDLLRPPVRHHTPDGWVSPSSRVVWSAEGPLHLELVRAEPGTVYDPARGTHLHHVGFWTDDLRGAIAACESQGWRVEVTMLDEQEQPVAFAYMSRPGEAWIELVDVANRPGLYATLRGGG